MNYIASGLLILWFPIVVIVFLAIGPRKAIPSLFVTGWLLLPVGGFALPGIPDYTKVTATVLALFLCLVVFDSGKLFSLRFQWYDLPITLWGLETFVTAIVNDLGPYEGLSALLDFVVTWGMPYVIGRVYLSDREGLLEFCRAVVIGALWYIPLCLIEMRISPILHQMLYGYSTHAGSFGLRLGGWRPTVFLSSGLELGMWMTNASLLGLILWYSGAVKNVRGVPIRWATLAIILTAVFCRSTGSIVLLGVGVLLFSISYAWKKPFLVWILIAIPPLYCGARTLNVWQGQELVDIARATAGDDRAQSLEFRLNMERLLADHALQRPVFGWGRMGQGLIRSSNGTLVTVPDGLWILQLSYYGRVGVACLLTSFLLPITVTLRRFPVSTWREPEVGPIVALSMILLLTMIDFLANAMVMPIQPLMMGAILTQLPYRRESGRGEAAEALSTASGLTVAGLVVEAAEEFHRAIDLASEGDRAESRRIQAEALDGLGHTYMATGRLEDSLAAFRQALSIRDELAAESPDDERFRDLAIARDGLSRALAEVGRTAEAVEHWQHAVQIWRILTSKDPKNREYRDHHVDTLNDLAWLLVTAPDPADWNASRALALIDEAVQLSPRHEALDNTLGVVRYRIGDWAGSVEALERSILSNPDGGTAFDHYFMAMAWAQLRRDDLAAEWFERAAAWASRHRPDHPALERFRDEAWSVLHQKA